MQTHDVLQEIPGMHRHLLSTDANVTLGSGQGGSRTVELLYISDVYLCLHKTN